jgi:L-ascorbate metabolism protein UlaG (beta-lactamase superfamily)
MELKRTANAGVLLKLDGVTILMDGVCREVKPYPATPPEVKAELLANMPDAVAFTHAHKDHYDPGFAAESLRQNGVIFGPAVCHGSMEPAQVGAVRITPMSSRHIGAAGKDTAHASFVIEGSVCIWFTGDASPSQWGRMHLPRPDVLIVPYAYCNTPSAWAATKALGAKYVVLLHMPDRQDDSIGLWTAVEETVGESSCLFIPAMNETVDIPVLCH